MSDAGDVTPSHEPDDSEDDQSTASSSPTVKFAGSPLLNSPTSKAAGSRLFSPDQPSPKRRRTGSERQDAAASPASAAGKPSCSTPSADADILLPRVSEQQSEDFPEPGRPRKDLEEEEREKMQVLVSYFTEDQLDRYEMYRRSAFPKAAIKRVMQTLTTCSVSQNAVIAMSGISKVFVGEIMEQALDVKEECGDTGPVQPKHLREAVRRLSADVNSCAPSVKLGRPAVQL